MSPSDPNKPPPPLPVDLRDKRLLRRRDVLALYPVHRRSLMRMVRLKLFPQPVRVTERTLMWRCADVLAWLENPPEAEPIDTPPPPSPELRRRKRAANSPLGAKGK